VQSNLDLGEILLLESVIGSEAALINKEKPPDPGLTEAPGYTSDGHSSNGSLGNEHAGLEAIDTDLLAGGGAGWGAPGEEGGKHGEGDAKEEEEAGRDEEGMEVERGG
jgi:hypothetical protein